MDDSTQNRVGDIPDSDDVEAHGLREVAVAAGLGAVVVGGGVAAASTVTTAARAPVSAAAHAGAAAHAADVAARPSAEQARALTTRRPAAVTELEQAADSDVKHTRDVVVQQVDAAVHHALHQPPTAAQAAAGAARSAELAVVQAVTDRIGTGWTVTAAVRQAPSAPGDGTGGALPTGTVTVLDAQGRTLGTARLIDGVATMRLGHLDAASYTVSYSGDHLFRSLQVIWPTPVP